MRWFLVLALLVSACASAETPPPFSGGATSEAADSNGDDDDDNVTKDDKKKSSSGDYTPAPPVPAAQSITAWRGHVDTSPMVDVVGSQGCTYHVVLDNIELHVSADGSGHITSSNLTNTMTETVSGCSAKPLGAQHHTYAFQPAATDTPTSTVLQVADPKNLPQAEVTLTVLKMDAGHIKARLLFHRTDATEHALDWRDSIDVALTPLTGG